MSLVRGTLLRLQTITTALMAAGRWTGIEESRGGALCKLLHVEWPKRGHSGYRET